MAEEMAAGAWAGLVGTVLGYPLDVVKGRMQTGKGIAESGAKASFGRTFVNMARTEGVAGMYRGLGPPVCMMMVMNSMNFGAFYWARERLAGPEPVGWGTEKGGIDWRVVAAATSVGRCVPWSAHRSSWSSCRCNSTPRTIREDRERERERRGR